MEDKFAFLDNMYTWLLDNGMKLVTNILSEPAETKDGV